MKMMKFEKTEIEGLIIIAPDLFKDDRGVFMETFHRDAFEKNGLPTHFVQDNLSVSKKHVLRGLHFQKPPHAQGKLVNVVHGAALDVAVDLRKNSPTCGKWKSVLLSGNNKLTFWIPEGFAHGFVALEDDRVFQYKCTNIYHKESEGSIRWNDPDLNIDGGVSAPIRSEKDAAAPAFKKLCE
jgi:dTDP-4-dehydrorhamnose 3,5-epimerase